MIAFFLLITLLVPSSISAHSTTATVSLTPNGFEPQQLTVDQNTTLTFLNQDSVDHWPASDFHPTHDLYPEFDPRKPIKPGEFWIVKLTKPGTWKYHDHLYPHRRATLIITPEPSSLPPTSLTPTSLLTQLKQFFTQLFHYLTSIFSRSHPPPSVDPQAFKNLSLADQYQALTQLAQSQGAPVSWKFVQDAFPGQSGMTGNIHDLAHFAGGLLYDHLGFAALTDCTPTFAFGCYHGFFDKAFAQSLDQVPQAQAACAQLAPGLSGPVASCLHGIGHGIASFHQTKNLNQALTDCDRLTVGQQYCYDGVFMEFARNASKDFYRAADPLYPCTILDQKYVFSCGRNQPTVMLQHFQFTFPQVITACTQTPTSDLRSACFDALGFIAAANNPGKAESIIATCNQIPSLTYRSRCAQSAAGELIFQDAPHWPTAAPQICDSLTSPHRHACWEHLNQLVKDYHRPPLLQPRSATQTPSDYLTSLMQTCLNLGSPDTCYQQIAYLLSREFSLKDSLTLLQTNETNSAVYARCHEVTHYLSRTEYTTTQSIPQVYASCDSTCHGGCYHGALEQYLKDTGLSPDSQAITHTIARLCSQIQPTSLPLVFYECFHGLGHAAMFISDMDVPLSLQLCDALDDQTNRDRCYGGVFMENSSSSTNTAHPGQYLKADDPLYPCNALDESYQRLCYRYQSSHFALITHHDWSQTAHLCQKVPQDYQLDCFRTIGTNQVGFTQDFSVMKANCDLMPNAEFQSTCISGVIASFAYRFVGDLDKMVDFCSLVSADHQPTCFHQIGTSVKDWATTPSQAQTFCRHIHDSQFSAWCQGII